MTSSSDWYSQGWQTWAAMMEQTQQNMLAFQQAVTSIQTARIRSIAAWWQQAPGQLEQVTGSASPYETMATWYGQTLEQAMTLAADTTAQRAHLWQQWQRPLPLATAPSASVRTPAPSLRPNEGRPQTTASALKTSQAAAPSQASSPATETSSNVVPMTSSTRDSFARTSSSSSVTGMRRGVANRLSRGRR